MMASVAPSAAAARLQADRLAAELDRRGLAAPTAIVLDAHRPLLPLLRQGVIFFGPMLAPVIGPRRFATLRRLLEDPTSYERLAARLAGDDRSGGEVVGPSDRPVGWPR